jgi:hypothetical protein
MITGRTSTEIYNTIIDRISENANLSSLTKTASTAIYKLYANVIAYILSIFEKNLENSYEELEEISTNNIIGTAKWLAEVAKNYQDGDTIVFDSTNNEFKYEEEDDEKKIITSSAVEEGSNKIILKVKKEDGYLDGDELERFIVYISTIKIAGPKIEIRSVESDKLRLNIDVFYDGQRKKSEIQSEVEDNINEYIENLDFNTTVRSIEIVDEIQKVDGVIDVHFKESKGQPLIGSNTDWTYTYKSYSGWCEIDPKNKLSDTITYSATKKY